MLATIDSILGDTETSKAIATIIVLIQREFRNPDTGLEHVSLTEVLSGAIGFAMLQRWGKERTEQELADTGTIERVWDLVVVDDGDRTIRGEERLLEESEPGNLPNEPDVVAQPRPISMISTGGDDDVFDGGVADDALSTFSNMSRRASVGDRPEQAFRQHLMQQLKPGTSVKVTSQSVTRNIVTVEIVGDDSPEVEPPQGFALVAVSRSPGLEDDTQKLVFQNKRRRTRRGSFHVDDQDAQVPGMGSVDATSGPGDGMEAPSIELDQGEPGPAFEAAEPPQPFLAAPNPPPEPIRANEKRPMSFPAGNRPPVAPQDIHHQRSSVDAPTNEEDVEHSVIVRTPKKSSLRKTLRRGKSYKNLVDFWNNRKNLAHPSVSEAAKARVPPFAWQFSSSQPETPTFTRRPSLSRAQTSYSRGSFEVRRSIDLDTRPGSRGSNQTFTSHKRASSSIYTLATASETSLVMHGDSQQYDRNDIAACLIRTGILPGQYPHGPFVSNVARFARFSVAAYGSRFLRFLGARTDAPQQELDADSSHLFEHNSFTSYARLPQSTVVLSSHMDPIGGGVGPGVSTGAVHSSDGLPLVHFVSLDHESKAVVLTCRGSLGFEDILTDMTCDYTEFAWGGKIHQVHKGMLAAARRLLSLHDGRLVATIKAALEEFEDYGLVLCGHSLGGGVTSLLGMMITQRNAEFSGTADSPVAAFVTASLQNAKHRLAQGDSRLSTSVADTLALTLPPNRPVHVYAYGPAATISPSLQHATRGLITSIVNGADHVPYLSLGTLRDFQAVALAFKHDTRDAKGEVRRRVWEGLRNAFRDKTGFSGMDDGIFASLNDTEEEDQWPWAALKSLRAGMTASRLAPPGECFLIECQAVLRRHAFVKSPDTGGEGRAETSAAQSSRAFKPASHVRLTHVPDVAKRFSELRFEASMWIDHVPARYEKACEALEKGLV